jgi:transcription termination factor Rho
VSDTDLLSSANHDAATPDNQPAAPAGDGFAQAEGRPMSDEPTDNGVPVRRRGGLTGMVLAELRQLASQLGIANTAGLRKGDLITAIKQRQGAGSDSNNDQLPLDVSNPAAGSNAAVPDTAATGTAAPDATAAAAPDTAAASAAAPDTGATGATAPDTGATAPDTAAAAADATAPDAAAAGTVAPDAAASPNAGEPNAPAPKAQHDQAPVDTAGDADVSAGQDPQSAVQDSQTRLPRRRSASRPAGAPDRDLRVTSDYQQGQDGEPVAQAQTERPERTQSTERPERHSERADSRGGERADSRGGERTDSRGGERTDSRSGERADGRSGERADGRSGERTDSRSGERTDNRSGERTDGRNGERTDGRNGERTDGRNGDSRNNDRDQQGDRVDSGQGRDDDDDAGGRRRGRRFRDRRRNRGERRPEGGNEPEVREDDVLLPVAGILDVLENYAFVRTSGYLAGPNDVYVSLSLVRKYGLRRGDAITGAVRQPRDGEQQRQKFNPLVRVDTINGLDVDAAKQRPEFTKLTPLYPNERLRLETEPHKLTTRVIDLVVPIGKGQRALIVSPPKAGKTMVLQAIANAITTNNPECHLMVVLVDERPEEVTDMQRSVKGEVIASTFDRPPSDHTTVSELAIERAKRLVEMGHDVVVLLDSITRLGRAYNLAAPASGRILSGGVDSTALYPPKRFLGAARNIEGGGSLTIFATALVETGSTGDSVIFEEFKGTGNAELKLDRKIADRRVFPAVDVTISGTRKEELLLSPDEMAVTIKLRRVLTALDPQQGIDLLLDRLRKTRTNIEFLMQVAKSTPLADDD